MIAAGIDGAPGGWVMAVVGSGPDHPSELVAAADVADLIEICRRRPVASVGIDIPIGFAVNGDRAADRLARALVGRRHSTVFTTPARAVLDIEDYPAASAENRSITGRGISKQTFFLLPRSREVRTAVDPADQPWVFEVHPECSFTALNHGEPLDSKHGADGRRQRIGLVESQVAADAAMVIMHGPAPATDALDAYAAAWSAGRRAAGIADVLGTGVDPDGYELTITV